MRGKTYLLWLFVLLTVGGGLSATTYYVKPTGSDGAGGTTWGTAWMTAARVSVGWTGSGTKVAGGDTVYFAPGSYSGQILMPDNTNPNDRTCYACSSFYDPGITWLQSIPNYTRGQFYQSIKMAKACTVSAAAVVPVGGSWTNYSGEIWYKDTTLPAWYFANERASVGGEDSTFLISRTALASIVGRGEFYHDPTANRIYVRCTDGASPATHLMRFSRQATFEAKAPTGRNYICNYTTVFGFDIQFSYFAGVDWAYSAVDSFFVQHCRIIKVGANSGSNEGAVGSQSSWSDDAACDADPLWCTYSMDGRKCKITAVYANQYYEDNASPSRSRILTSYQYSHTTVESCLAINIGGGIDWKNRGAAGLSYGNVMKFCLIKHPYHAGYENLGNNADDSCYGNIIVMNDSLTAAKGIALEVYTQRKPGRHFVCNNLIVGWPRKISFPSIDDEALATSYYTGEFDSLPNIFKYNILHDEDARGRPLDFWYSANDTNYLIDSNWYANCENRFSFDAAMKTWAQWQARASGNAIAAMPEVSGVPYHDIHSSWNTVTPTYADTANFDYRLTNGSFPLLMSRSYGGFTWDKLGPFPATASLPQTTTKRVRGVKRP